MSSNCPKVSHDYLNVPPNGAHWNSKPYIDDLLYPVLRVRSITAFNMSIFCALVKCIIFFKRTNKCTWI